MDEYISREASMIGKQVPVRNYYIYDSAGRPVIHIWSFAEVGKQGHH
jgi:hypothetical protein